MATSGRRPPDGQPTSPVAVGLAALALGLVLGNPLFLQLVLPNPGAFDTPAPADPAAAPPPPSPIQKGAPPAEAEPMFAFIGVITAPSYVLKRQAVRSTWMAALGDIGVRVEARFYVGHSEHDAAIAKENATYGDIVMLALDDGYDVLSSKVPAAIRHAHRTAQPFRYFVKVDDDTFIDVPGMVAVLQANKKESLYLGATWSGSRPHRNPISKHHLPAAVFPASMANLPPYNEGGGYVLSANIVKYIDQNRRMLRPLGPLEDVTIALWLLPLQIHPTSDRRFTSKNAIAGGSLTVKPALRIKHCRDDVLIMPDVDPDMMHAMWEYAERGYSVCGALAQDDI